MNDEDQRGWGERLFVYGAIFVLVLIIAGTILNLLPVVHSYFLSALNPPHHPTSTRQMKQMGVVFKMYANEVMDNVYPPLSPKPGLLMMEPETLIREFLSEPMVLVAPEHPDAEKLEELREIQNEVEFMREVGDSSYWYLGYTICDEETGLAFISAYLNAVVSGEPLSWDRDLETPRGSIHRLAERVEHRFLQPGASSQEIASEIPVLMENINLRGDGANVLFLDGHVEYIEYPGKFPMTRPFIEGLRSLDALEDIGADTP